MQHAYLVSPRKVLFPNTFILQGAGRSTRSVLKGHFQLCYMDSLLWIGSLEVNACLSYPAARGFACLSVSLLAFFFLVQSSFRSWDSRKNDWYILLPECLVFLPSAKRSITHISQNNPCFRFPFQPNAPFPEYWGKVVNLDKTQDPVQIK